MSAPSKAIAAMLNSKLLWPPDTTDVYGQSNILQPKHSGDYRKAGERRFPSVCMKWEARREVGFRRGKVCPCYINYGRLELSNGGVEFGAGSTTTSPDLVPIAGETSSPALASTVGGWQKRARISAGGTAG